MTVAARLLIAAGSVLLVSLGFEMFPIVPYLMQPYDVTGIGLILGYALLVAALVAFAVWAPWLPLRIALIVAALGWASLTFWFQLSQPDHSPFNTIAIALIVVGSLASGILLVVRRALPRPAALVFLATMLAALVDVFWERYPLWLQNVADLVHFGLLVATGILVLHFAPKSARASLVAPFLVAGLFILEGLALFGSALGSYNDNSATHAFEAGTASIQDTVTWIPLEVGSLALSAGVLAAAFVLLALRPVGIVLRILFALLAIQAALELVGLMSGVLRDFDSVIVSAAFVLCSLAAGVIVVIRNVFRRVPSILFLAVMVSTSIDPILTFVGGNSRPGDTETYISIAQASLFVLFGVAMLIWRRSRTVATG